MISQNSPLANYLSLKPAIDEALQRVVHSGQYILGPETAAFEKEFAEYMGVRHATGTGNGTDALHLALRAMGVGAGDEVITVSHTAVATVAATEMVNAIPILVDIDLSSYTMDLTQVQKAITSRTKAILPVHLYGQAADLGPLVRIAKDHGLCLIEDCAQAHGARYHGKKVGSWGDAGIFSFYPTKNLGCLGDGGAVVTDRGDIHRKLLALRQYGWDSSRSSQLQGFNSRLDEMQAAVLRVKLTHLDENNEKRAQIASVYDQSLDLDGVVLPKAMPHTTHVYHQYVLRCGERSIRDELRAFMKGQHIQTAIHYPVPIHLQPAYEKRLERRTILSVTEIVADTIVSLPMYPELNRGEIEKVTAALRDFFARRKLRNASRRST
jgi:dTDP-4-amino-4,6-dideoxygalactose transaminase